MKHTREFAMNLEALHDIRERDESEKEDLRVMKTSVTEAKWNLGKEVLKSMKCMQMAQTEWEEEVAEIVKRTKDEDKNAMRRELGYPGCDFVNKMSIERKILFRNARRLTETRENFHTEYGPWCSENLTTEYFGYRHPSKYDT